MLKPQRATKSDDAVLQTTLPERPYRGVKQNMFKFQYSSWERRCLCVCRGCIVTISQTVCFNTASRVQPQWLLRFILNLRRFRMDVYFSWFLVDKFPVPLTPFEKSNRNKIKSDFLLWALKGFHKQNLICTSLRRGSQWERNLCHKRSFFWASKCRRRKIRAQI